MPSILKLSSRQTIYWHHFARLFTFACRVAICQHSKRFSSLPLFFFKYLIMICFMKHDFLTSIHQIRRSLTPNDFTTTQMNFGTYID